MDFTTGAIDQNKRGGGNVPPRNGGASQAEQAGIGKEMKTVRVIFVLVVLVAARYASAQQHEFAIAIGGYVPISSGVPTDAAFIVQGTLAERLLNAGIASLYFELPVAKTLDVDVGAPDAVGYDALFITPGLKLKLWGGFFTSPYFSLGVGYARFTQSTRVGSSVTKETNSGTAVDFAGGLDIKIAPFVSLRGELRDFYAGSPRFVIPGIGLGSRQHNLTGTAGVVLRF